MEADNSRIDSGLCLRDGGEHTDGNGHEPGEEVVGRVRVVVHVVDPEFLFEERGADEEAGCADGVEGEGALFFRLRLEGWVADCCFSRLARSRPRSVWLTFLSRLSMA